VKVLNSARPTGWGGAVFAEGERTHILDFRLRAIYIHSDYAPKTESVEKALKYNPNKEFSEL
jgi:hypothetical protein